MLRNFPPRVRSFESPSGDSPPVVSTTDLGAGIELVALSGVSRSEARTWLLAADWGWEQTRDYVAAQIEARWGVFPRDPAKERSIFVRFCRDWPDHEAIARYAFEHCDGMWAGAPIRVTRFCKGSDDFFAAEIRRRIVAAAPA